MNNDQADWGNLLLGAKDYNRRLRRKAGLPAEEINLQPQPPPLPATYRAPMTGYDYVIEAPQPNPNFVLVGNRDNFKPTWQRLGDELNPDQIGRTSYNSLYNGPNGPVLTYQPDHHNRFLPQESSMSQADLVAKLNEYNLPTTGDRSALFRRLINLKEMPDMMTKFQSGEPWAPEDITSIENPPRNLPELAQLRAARPPAQPAPPVANNPASGLSSQEWVQRNLANRARDIELLNQPGGRNNPMTVNNMNRLAAAEGAAPAVAPAAAAVPEVSFASRALPMVNMALLVSALMQNANAQKRARQQEERSKQMRT